MQVGEQRLRWNIMRQTKCILLLVIACLCGVVYLLLVWSPSRIKTVRIIVPSSMTGLFQVEGLAKSPNSSVTTNGEVGIIVVPSGSRYAGLRDASPLIKWHNLEIMDSNKRIVPRANTVNEITDDGRSVLVLGIAGRPQLSWFAIGTRGELLKAIDEYSQMIAEGRLSLP